MPYYIYDNELRLQIKLPKNTASLNMSLMRADGTGDVATHAFVVQSYEERIYDIGFLIWNLHDNFDCGDYYVFFDYPGTADTWYSDLIRIVEGGDGLLRIRYRHHKDLELPTHHLDFTEGQGAAFEYIIYLKASSQTNDILGKPQYFFEEVVTRRRGYNYYQQLISGKRYLFETMVSEPVMDGLRLLKLFSDIYIREIGRPEKKVHDVYMNVSWESWGYAAFPTIEFDTDTVVVSNTKARHL